uniref:5-oxoprolinase subunit PxpB n=1 Tax=Paenibacillus turpanensis TaxID=2689078 RepID=UPI00140E6FB0
MEIYASGDRALTLRFGEAPTDEVRASLRAVMQQLMDKPLAAVQEVVPAYTTLTLLLDRVVDDEIAETVRRYVEKVILPRDGTEPEDVNSCSAETDEEQRAERDWSVSIPVIYGGEHGPDLQEAASRCGLSEDEVIRLHSSRSYEVCMLGFAAGFPYLLGLPPELAVPRRGTPRTKVPAGSVAIGGVQTGIYPSELPGGWSIIGRTPLKLFDAYREPQALLRAGDRVRFVPVTADEASAWAQAGVAGGAPADGEAMRLDAAGEQSSAAVCEGETSAPAEGARLKRGGSLGGDAAAGALLVERAGPLASVQAAPRIAGRALGVAPGGAADPLSLRIANVLVGNPQDAAALELTLGGAALICERDTLLAVCGADAAPQLDGRPLPMWRPVLARAGSRIGFRAPLRGCRVYVAVAGGIDMPPWLGSRATDLRVGAGGYRGRALRAG